MKILSILLLIALAVVLSVQLGPKLFPKAPGDDFSSSAQANRLELVGPPEGIGAEPYTFVYTADSRSLPIKEGELRVTVTGAQVITNLSQLPAGSFVPGHDRVELQDENGDLIYYAHAVSEVEAAAGVLDFVLPDGSFIDGVYMVALDIALENAGCSCRTRLDQEHPGTFYDPCLFGVQNFFDLYALGKSASNTGDGGDISRNSMSLAFYSGYGKGDPDAPDAEFDAGGNVTNHKLSVRLEPGESADITLGYIVSRRWTDNILPDPGDFFAACIGINDISRADVEPAIYLGLEEETEGYR